MLSPNIVFGYHGCDEGVARMVLDGGQLKPSENAHDWLGHGIYFWEQSPAGALRWAQEIARQRASSIRKLSVNGAILDLHRFLNLIEPESADLVRAAYQNYLLTALHFNVLPLKNEGKESKARFLDCAVMNLLHKIREAEGLPAFDTVRGFFHEGQPVYPTAGLRTLDHVQVCVRNTASILGFFRPNLSR